MTPQVGLSKTMQTKSEYRRPAPNAVKRAGVLPIHIRTYSGDITRSSVVARYISALRTAVEARPGRILRGPRA